jgi:UDP-N-acetylglucosamine enolpyruvyl transferase
MGMDVRGAGALVIAGLGADAQTVVGGLEHLDRGYASAVLVGIDFQTRPYPGFAIDLQAPVMAMLSTVGASMASSSQSTSSPCIRTNAARSGPACARDLRDSAARVPCD